MIFSLDTDLMTTWMNSLLGALDSPLSIFIGIAIGSYILRVVRSLF